MIKFRPVKYKYAFSCVLSSVAGLMGLINPILSSLLVKRAKEGLYPERLLPVLIAMLAVKGARIALRASIAKYLGGNRRAPLIWLQHRVGKWLWWLEPLLHNWGWVGMVITKFSGKNGLATQLASALIYTLTDTLITVTAGILYYFTSSYLLSFLSILILPAWMVLPWLTQKTFRLHARREEKRPVIIKRGQIR